MEVFVVSYFYPGGTFAGIIGVYSTQIHADAVIMQNRMTDYPDCTFITTVATIDQ